MRYKVIESSVTAHCCFEASVIDTTINKDLSAEYVMCECFSIPHANKICELLNKDTSNE